MVRSMRIAWVLAAGLFAAGCGSSETPKATPAATATATATAAPIEDAAVEKMPGVEPSSFQAPPPSAKVHDVALLHSAFESSEAMWNQEFSAAGMPYQHAKLSFFHSTVRTPCG